MARVVLAMSGGVDSSVAAHLLLRDGHDVIGVFMRHGETSPVACRADTAADVATNSATKGTSSARPPIASHSVTALPVTSLPVTSLPVLDRVDHKQGCCTASDAEDARRVADRLGIPFYALNLQAEFRRIIDYFVAEYAAARTPNPCVMCNNWIKFGKLFDYADSVGATYVATGHYARLVGGPDGESPQLLRGRDSSKDQSYVLAGIDARLLPRMLLPVGDFEKTEIRRLAAEIGLRVADKKDSQEICFVAAGKHDEFVRARTPDANTAGEIVTTDGAVVGRHPGIEGFTIGQRKGLRVALGEPRFVVRIEPDSHRVVIGARDDLARGELTASEANWLVGLPNGPPEQPFHGSVQIRYNSRAVPATIEPLAGRRFHVTFDDPCHGVAPGQAAVCYQGDRVLGGGWID